LDDYDTFIGKTSPKDGLVSGSPTITVEVHQLHEKQNSLACMLTGASFLPIFSRLKTAPAGLANVVVTILKEIIGLGNFDSGYFGIIKQYLIRFSADSLDYSLFLAFFALYQATNIPLLFDNLIANVELWSSAPADCFLRVVNHWAHTTVNTSASMFSRPLAFSRVLKMFHFLFFGQRLEGRYSDVQIRKCRDVFLMLISAVGRLTFSSPDASLLLQMAFKAPTEELLLVSFKIVERIAPKIRAVAPDFIDILHVFIEHERPSVVLGAIHAIHELCTPFWQKQMTGLAAALCDHEHKAWLFDKLVEAIADYPGTIHLLCVLALDVDDKALSQFVAAVGIKFTDAESLPNLLADEFWFIWLFLLAAQLNSEAGRHFLHLISLSMAGSPDFYREVDLLIDVAQLLECVVDFDVSLVLLEVLVAISRLSTKSAPLLLGRCFRLMYFRITDSFTNPALIRLYLDSPFGPDTEFVLRSRVKNLQELNALLTPDCAKCKLTFGMSLDDSNHVQETPMLIFCTQVHEMAKMAEYDLLADFGKYLLDKKWKDPLHHLKVLREMNAHIAEVQDHINAQYLQRMSEVFVQLRDFIAEACRARSAEFGCASQRFSSFKAAVDPSAEPPSAEAVADYIKRVTFSSPASPEQVVSRDVSFGFAPAKMRYLNDFANAQLFALESRLDFSRAFENTIVVISLGATLWEFGKPRQVQVDVGNHALLLYDVKSVIESLKNKDVRMILPRGTTAMEVFTARRGSFYLDFGTLGNERVLEKLASVDLRFAGEPRSYVAGYLSEPVTNFEYLMVLNLASGRTFHVEGNTPVFPVGEEVVTIEKFCWPTLPFSVVCENRRRLERQDVRDFAQKTFGDLALPAPPLAVVDPLQAFTRRDLLLPEESRAIAGNFFGYDLLYIILSSGEIQFVRVSDKPHPIGVQHPGISGEVILAPDGLVIVADRRVVQFVTSQAVLPTIDLKLEVEFPVVVGNKLLFVSNECVVHVCEFPDPETTVSELLVSRERICGLEANLLLNAVAVVTEDGFVYIHSLSSGELTAMIQLKKSEPDRITMTPSWGCIVAVVGLDIEVYTINGEFIGQLRIDVEIREWTVFSDAELMDYVAFVDLTNRIGVFEIGNLDRGVHIISGRWSTLLAVRYMRERKCLAGLTDDGLLTLHPFPED
jgi:hypothetical protein